MWIIRDFNTGRVVASGFESYAHAFTRAMVLEVQGSLPDFVEIVQV
jgi:hypothetical protein